MIGREAAKAVMAGLVAALAALGNGLADDVLSYAEGVGVLGSAVAAYAAVYLTPNDTSSQGARRDAGG